MFRSRDFIETKEGLFFASITPDVAFLRYFPSTAGSRLREGVMYEKVGSTKSSFEYLEKNYPHYIEDRGSHRLQRCPPKSISKIHSPVQKLEELKSLSGDLIEKCLMLSDILGKIPGKHKGVTGSLLVDLHLHSSDIDFVVYGNQHFESARNAIFYSDAIRAPIVEEWRCYYKKRFPTNGSLTFESFLWHEQRKNNIGVVDGTLFNLLKVGRHIGLSEGTAVKKVRLRCTVTDARYAFNLPALYLVDHADVNNVVSFTHSYTGQARAGEEIEVSGVLEKTDGGYRVVVGTTREAEGEYIRVIDPTPAEL